MAQQASQQWPSSQAHYGPRPISADRGHSLTGRRTRDLVEGLHILDLFDEVGLLIVELVVLGAVVVKLGQKVDELVSIAQKDLLDGPRLVRVGHKHLAGAASRVFALFRSDKIIIIGTRSIFFFLTVPFGEKMFLAKYLG